MSGTVAPLNGLRPDIALQAGHGVQPVQNPLATFGQFAGIQNQLTQNRAMEAGIKQTEAGTRGMELDQSFKKLGAWNSFLGGVLAQNPDGIPPGAVTAALAGAYTNGIVTPDQIGAMLQQIPMGADPESTAKRTSMIQQAHFQGLAIAEQVARTRGAPMVMQTGGEAVPGMMSERGFEPAGGTVPMTLSPGQAASVVQLPAVGPDGRPTGAMEPVTGAEVARRGGLGGLVAPGTFANGGRMPAASPAVPPPPTAAPTAPTRPAVPAAAAPPVAAPGRPTGSLGTTQTPAAATAQTGNAAKGVEQGAALIRQAEGVPAQRAMLGEMDSLLDSVKTGKKQDQLLAVRQYVQSLAPERLKALFGLDADSVKSIADAELLKKLFTQFGTQAAGSAGLNTDQARNIVFGGNPNFDISTLGNKQIVGLFRGTLDYIDAMASAWRESPNYETGDYARFITQWNKTSDPRVFQFYYMDRDTREKMLKADPALAAKIRAMYSQGQ